MTTHLFAPPSSAFWLDELRLAVFDEVQLLQGDRDGLQRALGDEYQGPAGERALAALRSAVDGDAADVHALLVAMFLRHKKSAAVSDVASAVLPPAVLDEWRAGGRRLPRLSAALAMYMADPHHLLDVEVCHRWHSRRRCALVLAGPQRTLPRPAAELDWESLAATAQVALEAAVGRLRGQTRFRRATFRQGKREVLLAWSAPAERDTVRHAAGHVVAGHHDDWTILRVHADGVRVDVTSSQLSVGEALADGLATALWSKGHYRRAEHKLTGETLNELLRRLREPDDDTFQLLEITAEVPGLPDRPVLVVTNSGQARVEAAVQEIRRHMAFAERWETVHRVKIAFGEAWRIEVHFPTSDEEMLLTYSDSDRDKEVAAAFEKLMFDELRVEIHPKAGRARRRERKEEPAPRRPGRATWLRLIAPVVDNPAAWERGLLAELARQGVVSVQDLTFFRCSEGPVLSARRDTLDCPGEVEMPYGRKDPNDRFRQEDDAQHTCGLCGTTWYPGRYRLPVTHRLRVRPAIDGVWRHVLRMLVDVGPFQEEVAGTAGGIIRGQRAQVVFLPIAPAQPWHQPAVAAMFPTCWVSVPDDPRLAAFGDRGVDLADVLAEGAAAFRRTLDLGASGYIDPAAFLAAEPDPSPYRATPGAPATPVEPKPTTRYISLDDKGVWLAEKKLVAAKAGGTRLLLAILHHLREDDRRASREPMYRTAESIVSKHSGGTFTYQDVQTWVSRTRKAIRTAFPTEAGLDGKIIEGGEGVGYRIGPEFECIGFQLTAELAKRQP